MKTSKNNTANKKTNWKEMLPILFSLISLSISSVSLYQSYKAQQFSRQETERQYFSFLYPSYYPAQSPDLKSEYDIKSLSNFCTRRMILTTDYWRQTKAASSKDTTRYVFLIISNRGPGMIKDFHFSDLDWEPKDKVVAPNIITGAENVQSFLDKGECLALLVDVLSSYDETKSLSKQPDIHFTDVVIKYSYDDLLGNPYESSEINLGKESLISIELTK